MRRSRVTRCCQRYQRQSRPHRKKRQAFFDKKIAHSLEICWIYTPFYYCWIYRRCVAAGSTGFKDRPAQAEGALPWRDSDSSRECLSNVKWQGQMMISNGKASRDSVGHRPVAPDQFRLDTRLRWVRQRYAGHLLRFRSG